MKSKKILAIVLVVALLAAGVTGAVVLLSRGDKLAVGTVSGSATRNYVDGTIDAAAFASPASLLVNGSDLYVFDTANNVIRKITYDTVSTVAGTPWCFSGVDTGGYVLDGAALESFFYTPTAGCFNSGNVLYFADSGSGAVRYVDFTENTAGTFIAPANTNGYPGGSGTASLLRSPYAVISDGADGFYISDTLNHCILHSDAAGNLTVYAGTPGTTGTLDGSAGEALFLEPTGMALGTDGTLYVADSGNSRIRVIKDGTVSTLFGACADVSEVTGRPVGGDLDGDAAVARLSYPKGLALGADGTLYIADTNNNKIKAYKDGSVYTVAGSSCGFVDSADALTAKFNMPEGIAVFNQSILYVADSGNNAVRVIDLTSVKAEVTEGKTGTEGVTEAEARTVTVSKLVLNDGKVTLKRGAEVTDAYEGMRLAAGDCVLTDKYARVFLSIDDDKTILLDKCTSLTINSSGKKLLLSVNEGSMVFDVANPLKDDETCEFNAGGSTMSIRGTQGVIITSTDALQAGLTEGKLHVEVGALALKGDVVNINIGEEDEKKNDIFCRHPKPNDAQLRKELLIAAGNKVDLVFGEDDPGKLVLEPISFTARAFGVQELDLLLGTDVFPRGLNGDGESCTLEPSGVPIGPGAYSPGFVSPHNSTPVPIAAQPGEQKYVCSVSGHISNSYYTNSIIPTCTHEGYLGDMTCRVCNEVLQYGVKLSALRHVPSTERVNVTEATCIGNGYTGDIKCILCNSVVEQGTAVNALGHTPADERVNVTEATCTGNGYTGDIKCTVCNEMLEQGTEVNALGHKPADERVNVTEATCTGNGYTGDIKCTVCNEILEQGTAVNALGHKPADERVNVTKPTCTENGYTGDIKCTVCNGIVEQGTVIPALGHKPADERVNVTKPTCTENGYTGDIKCTVCNGIAEQGTVIPALGHTPSDERVNVTKPTCTENGYTGDIKCTVCNGIAEQGTVIPALGHTPSDERVNVTEATCTESGYTGDIKCSVCNETLEQGTVIPALGHTPSDERVNVTEPTCTEGGYTGDIICSICNEMLEQGTPVKALGHTPSTERVNVTEATCTGNGYTGDIKCTVCDEVLEQGTVINALGHTPSTERVNVTEATCTENGYTGDIKCSVCNEILEQGTVTKMLGHDYVYTYSDTLKHTVTCSRCDYESSESHTAAPCGVAGHCTICNDSSDHYIMSCGHPSCDTSSDDHSLAGCGEHYMCELGFDSHEMLMCGHFACDEVVTDHSIAPCETHFVCDGLDHDALSCGDHYACAVTENDIQLHTTLAECGTHYLCDRSVSHKLAACGEHHVCEGGTGHDEMFECENHYVCSGDEAADHTQMDCGHYKCDSEITDHTLLACGNHFTCCVDEADREPHETLAECGTHYLCDTSADHTAASCGEHFNCTIDAEDARRHETLAACGEHYTCAYAVGSSGDTLHNTLRDCGTHYGCDEDTGYMPCGDHCACIEEINPKDSFMHKQTYPCGAYHCADIGVEEPVHGYLECGKHCLCQITDEADMENHCMVADCGHFICEIEDGDESHGILLPCGCHFECNIEDESERPEHTTPLSCGHYACTLPPDHDELNCEGPEPLVI